jgi:hypothetical protein
MAKVDVTSVQGRDVDGQSEIAFMEGTSRHVDITTDFTADQTVTRRSSLSRKPTDGV